MVKFSLTDEDSIGSKDITELVGQAKKLIEEDQLLDIINNRDEKRHFMEAALAHPSIKASSQKEVRFDMDDEAVPNHASYTQQPEQGPSEAPSNQRAAGLYPQAIPTAHHYPRDVEMKDAPPFDIKALTERLEMMELNMAQMKKPATIAGRPYPRDYQESTT
jgi:hypothetical protein